MLTDSEGSSRPSACGRVGPRRRLTSALHLITVIVALSVFSIPGPHLVAGVAAAGDPDTAEAPHAQQAPELPPFSELERLALLPRGAVSPNRRLADPAAERKRTPRFQWLRHINAVRAAAGLPPVSEVYDWSVGSMLHSRYMVKNNYVGHDEDANNPWYTPEGQAAGLHGNAYANYQFDEPEQQGIDAWLSTPFHLINVLDPRLTHTGFGWYREVQAEGYQIGATLDVARGLDPSRGPLAAPVFFPAHGKTMPYARYFGFEYPDPLTSCPDRAFQGAPIVAQFPGLPRVSQVTLVKDGLLLDRCVFDETTYTNPDPEAQEVGRQVLAGRHAVTIVPREPLTAGTYHVTLVSGGVTFAWSFAGPASPTSAPAPAAPMTGCSARQDAGVGVVRQGADRFLTIVATRGEHNRIRQLHFGGPAQPLENAAIELNGYPAPISLHGTVTLPPDTTRVAFAVQRVASGQPFRAPFTIADRCGDWPAVVEAPATP